MLITNKHIKTSPTSHASKILNINTSNNNCPSFILHLKIYND